MKEGQTFFFWSLKEVKGYFFFSLEIIKLYKPLIDHEVYGSRYQKNNSYGYLKHSKILPFSFNI